MKKMIIISAVLLSGSGCASTHHVSNAQPAMIQAVSPKPDYQLIYGNDERVQHAYEQYLKTGKAANMVTNGFEQFAYGNSQPIINASPFELTVISLEEGEVVTKVRTGDPMRWSYDIAYSGAGRERMAQILIKPSQPSISTDMVITTDKRMYTFKLVSTNNGKYQRNVKFWYPEEIQEKLQSTNVPSSLSQFPDIHLDSLNFNYNIHTPFLSSPKWTPTRVFDDGVHTFIQIPADASSTDLPALFVLDPYNDNKTLVNYRFKKPYFIVDKIFKEAELVLGVGNTQSKVTIVNKAI